MQPLSEGYLRRVLADLDTGCFGTHVYYFEQVGSTNDVLRNLAERGAPQGTLVVADYQTAGRGRRGRTWVATPGANLLMSVLFRPALPPDRIYRLVMACGLAVAEAVEGTAGVSVEVKWPNDLLIKGRKLAGILPESAFVGDDLVWVIVGIGVNINQVFAPPDPLAETAISLSMATGREHDRAHLLGQVMARLHHWHERLPDAMLPDAWRARCVTLGQRIRVDMYDAILAGVAEELDDGGTLWLRDDSGQRHRLTAGEATILSDP